MTKAVKVEYSEQEAAKLLGLSVEELRGIIRRHFGKGEEGTSGPPSYQASDLVLLRILAKMPTPSHSVQ